MKYIYDQTAYRQTECARYNAINKARVDVTKIFESEGFKPYNIYVAESSIPKMTGTKVLFRYFKMLIDVHSGDELYIQYPIKKSLLTPFYYILSILKKKGVRFYFLIHDLDYLRETMYYPYKARILKPLMLADLIVAHTPTMKQHLISEGINAEINILHLFGYLTNDPLINEDYGIKHRNEVIFAGNLVKSGFVRVLMNYNFKYAKFKMYGLKPDYDFIGEKQYMGAFKPEETSFIKGAWGLVWDGDSIDDCTGEFGNYLKYNSSHKLSLYIASGIPVIVWSKSGLAEWIVSNKLGITLDSLKELDEALESITNEEYKAIQRSVRSLSSDIRSGKTLKRAFNICE